MRTSSPDLAVQLIVRSPLRAGRGRLLASFVRALPAPRTVLAAADGADLVHARAGCSDSEAGNRPAINQARVISYSRVRWCLALATPAGRFAFYGEVFRDQAYAPLPRSIDVEVRASPRDGRSLACFGAQHGLVTCFGALPCRVMGDGV